MRLAFAGELGKLRLVLRGVSEESALSDNDSGGGTIDEFEMFFEGDANKEECLVCKDTNESWKKYDSQSLLRNFWKPDGITIDQENEARLKEWLKKNTDRINIAGLIRLGIAEKVRLKAIKDLGLEK